jgi:hypothetical protein
VASERNFSKKTSISDFLYAAVSFLTHQICTFLRKYVLFSVICRCIRKIINSLRSVGNYFAISSSAYVQIIETPIFFQWHYEGHFARELERLNHIRVRKQPIDFPDRHTRRQVRDSALERISQRRSRRQTRPPPTAAASSGAASTSGEAASSDELTCPVCNLPVASGDYGPHVDQCLLTSQITNQDAIDDDEDVDIDSEEGLETYTWAGHTRVRATSLVQGGLRGPGFISITRSDEDQVLDIEGGFSVFQT